MPIGFNTVSVTHIVVEGNFTVEFDLNMPEHHVIELITLFGNNRVDKIQRIKWVRSWLNIGLREAKEFIEQAETSTFNRLNNDD